MSRQSLVYCTCDPEEGGKIKLWAEDPDRLRNGEISRRYSPVPTSIMVPRAKIYELRPNTETCQHQSTSKANSCGHDALHHANAKRIICADLFDYAEQTSVAPHQRQLGGTSNREAPHAAEMPIPTDAMYSDARRSGEATAVPPRITGCDHAQQQQTVWQPPAAISKTESQRQVPPRFSVHKSQSNLNVPYNELSTDGKRRDEHSTMQGMMQDLVFRSLAAHGDHPGNRDDKCENGSSQKKLQDMVKLLKEQFKDPMLTTRFDNNPTVMDVQTSYRPPSIAMPATEKTVPCRTCRGGCGKVNTPPQVNCPQPSKLSRWTAANSKIPVLDGLSPRRSSCASEPNLSVGRMQALDRGVQVRDNDGDLGKFLEDMMHKRDRDCHGDQADSSNTDSNAASSRREVLKTVSAEGPAEPNQTETDLPATEDVIKSLLDPCGPSEADIITSRRVIKKLGVPRRSVSLSQQPAVYNMAAENIMSHFSSNCKASDGGRQLTPATTVFRAKDSSCEEQSPAPEDVSSFSTYISSIMEEEPPLSNQQQQCTQCGPNVSNNKPGSLVPTETSPPCECLRPVIEDCPGPEDYETSRHRGQDPDHHLGETMCDQCNTAQTSACSQRAISESEPANQAVPEGTSPRCHTEPAYITRLRQLRNDHANLIKTEMTLLEELDVFLEKYNNNMNAACLETL